MALKTMLATYYAIHDGKELVVNGRDGYKYDGYLYFIILMENKEIIYMEQAALAYYLVEKGYPQMAIPIRNINNEWFTIYEGNNYMVIQVQQVKQVNEDTNGKLLADFHQIGTLYNFEPQAISSYGQWKQLWIDKLTAFENKIVEEARENPSDYYRLVMDTLPYLIGISENAIQYIQESERDTRYDGTDQGTIAFKRYTTNLEKPVIWTHDLVYDHPARDIAEYIRFMMLTRENHDAVVSFMNSYQSVRPLSVFSWRLLYARLVFPIHLFDQIDNGFANPDLEVSYIRLQELLEKQTHYEGKLRNFFEHAGVDRESHRIPVLHWL
ncbi:hypothetical protein QGM71_15675 [Virgibacillus sp. C22-A2]|uniref:Spore coat protein YutH n=1 Tax=Virgibacillus tibetensis TaxID=3042313 RepID=A0ABU6KHZ3_9BACI|nr:hypothetical protein [Virgibacillus sp. C22-A2]